MWKCYTVPAKNILPDTVLATDVNINKYSLAFASCQPIWRTLISNLETRRVLETQLGVRRRSMKESQAVLTSSPPHPLGINYHRVKSRLLRLSTGSILSAHDMLTVADRSMCRNNLQVSAVDRQSCCDTLTVSCVSRGYFRPDGWPTTADAQFLT